MQEGGYVDSPTPTIVGENSSNPNRKSPEIITPLDKVPKILAEANTIEKANMNASQTAFNITNENQTVKQEDATNQSQAMVNNSNPVLMNKKKLNPFDKMNYKKAFLNNLNIQGLEDKYLYKLDQIL